KVDGIESGHHQDAAEQAVNPELGVEHASRCPSEHARNKAGKCGQYRWDMAHEQGGGDGSPESDRTVRSDIGEIENTETQINSEGEEGENESDGGGADQEGHSAGFKFVEGEKNSEAGRPNKPRA